MSPTNPKSHSFRFGVFEFDPRARELRKQGRRIKLHGQPVEILALLLEQPGDVVTREELQKRLWPADTFVDFEHGVNAAMKRLRAALDDDADNPRFIETLPRIGYRFIAQVEASGGAVPATALTRTDSFTRRAVSALVEAVLEAHHARTRWRVWALMALTVAVAVAAVFLGSNVPGWRAWLTGKPAAGRIRSIAVLPLANLSGNPGQEYFADGMTDALITELGRISALRVISRTSVMRYKGTNKPVKEIARELGVDGVIEGSVQRSGERVRLTANLIDARNDQHLWAEIYDRDLRDVLSVESDFVQAVVQQVRVSLAPQEQNILARKRHVNLEAYQLYLQGRYLAARVNEANLRKSLEYFQRAIEKDPNYAEAYTGLADSYSSLAYIGTLPVEEGYSKVRAAASRALELDESLGEAHEALGYYDLYYQWDGPAAEQEFRRAIDLNPNHPDGYLGYANYLEQVGRFEEAIAENRHAQQLDPLAPRFSLNLGDVLLRARRYDEAIQQFEKIVELNPSDFSAHYGLARAYLEKGMFARALAEAEKGNTLWNNPALPFPGRAYVYARVGKAKEARSELAELERQAKTAPAWAHQVAAVYVALGEKDQAFSWLEKAYQGRSSFLRWLKVDTRFEPLRSDPRFQDLLRRVGLPP